MAPFWFFTTQWLQSVHGYSPVQAGLAFLPVTLPNFAAALAIPRLTRRYGNPTVLVGGLLRVRHRHGVADRRLGRARGARRRGRCSGRRRHAERRGAARAPRLRIADRGRGAPRSGLADRAGRPASRVER
jgi:hypothetical protein